jgi:phosphoenolpyruvate synthase/pyruvate phosphate dikinase
MMSVLSGKLQKHLDEKIGKGYELLFENVGAPLSHAAIMARELGTPADVGCGNATLRLKQETGLLSKVGMLLFEKRLQKILLKK